MDSGLKGWISKALGPHNPQSSDSTTGFVLEMVSGVDSLESAVFDLWEALISFFTELGSVSCISLEVIQSRNSRTGSVGAYLEAAAAILSWESLL